MIVIGLDVHKHSFTAVAVDEVGRMLDERTVPGAMGALIEWASKLGPERLWAVEDCRQLTRTVERDLLAVGEELVRVPPKQMAPERRTGRERGKSDPIDALAVARVAVRETGLSRPRADEEIYRDMKLLVDHRDDLVDERRRMHSRLRWHLHQLDPSFAVGVRKLGRASHLERVARWLAAQPDVVQVRIARELVIRCRSLNETIAELDRELEQRAHRRSSRCPAAAPSPPRSCSPRSAQSTGSTATHSSPDTAASHRCKRAQERCNATGSTAAATASSTPRSTGSRSPKPATTPTRAPTSNANKPKAKAAAKPSAASNDSSSASSSPHSKQPASRQRSVPLT